jgi:hypothetical protein
MPLEYRDGEKVFLVLDPDFEDWEDLLKFRVTYAGQLKSKATGPEKTDIRLKLSNQFRRLWHYHPVLKDLIYDPETDAEVTTYPEKHGGKIPLWKKLSQIYENDGWKYVPLVSDYLSLTAGIDILYLRPDIPGNILTQGDIDNRLKTLFDALKKPGHSGSLGRPAPPPDQQPVFVLLEDDRLVSSVSVETDRLLEYEPVKGEDPNSYAHLIMTITVKAVNYQPNNRYFI